MSLKGKTYQFNLMSFLIALGIGEIVFWGLAILGWQYLESNEPSFKFENGWVLWIGLIAIPLLIGAYLFLKSWINGTLKRYADYNLLPHLSTGYSNAKAIAKYLLLRFGFSFLIIAGANPQFGNKEREFVSKGIDIMIALDVSKSMEAQDLVEDKSRLYIAKKSIKQLIDQLHGDHIGLVVFAGSAFKQLPITPDYNVAKMFIDHINTDMMSSQGTDIGNAIEECMSAFDTEKPTNKVIIVFSDGEDHEENGINAAQLAQEEGVIVHTIGMATTKETPIPVFNKYGKRTGYKSDENGNTVLTKLNEDILINVAEAGAGSYTRAQGYSIGLNGLVGNINQVEKAALNKDKFLTYDDHFQIFLVFGIICIFVESLLSESKKNTISQVFKTVK